MSFQDIQNGMRKHAFNWPWEDPRQTAQIEADVNARTMQAEANAIRKDRGLPTVAYVDPTAHTGRAVTPEELEYKKTYTDWIVQQFVNGRKGGGVPSWKGYQVLKDKPGTDLPASLREYHDLGIRKRDREPEFSPKVTKAISFVRDNGGSPEIARNPALYRWQDNLSRHRLEDTPGALRHKYMVNGRGVRYYPNINKNTPLPYSGDYRPDRSVEATMGTNKTASAYNLQMVHRTMIKQAGLFGNTMLGRGINDLVGHDTFVGRVFGTSPEQEAEDFFRSQEALGEREARRRAAAEYDALQAVINAHIDRGLVAANKRLAADTGVTQRRQIAQLAPKLVAQPVPRVLNNTEKQMQQYRAKEDQAATTYRGNQLMVQQFARQGMNPYVSQQQIAESQRQTEQDKAMAQKQREIYGKPKRAPGIYNAQGQRWNGKAFV